MDVSKEEDELPKAVSELRLDSNEPDPWRTAEPDVTPVQAPDPSTSEPETVGGLNEKDSLDDAVTDKQHSAVDPDVLQSFDPLATSDDQNAWVDSEGNPPPVPSKSEPDTFSTPSTSSQPLPSSTSEPQPQPPRNFPGAIANIARGFTLPSVNMNIKTLVAGKQRSRPQSMDFATVIQTPTPVSAGSFAQQQMGHERTRSNLVPDDAVAEARGSPKLSGAVTGVDSPRVRAISREASGSRPGSRASGDPPAFDFQRFLDQMKAKSAEPIAKYLRSFLNNFTKRTFTVADQIKLINDFLGFISTKMRDVEPWKTANEQEFENAMEGMEKLVMNRLYDFIFTPQVARAIPPRPITTDDLERDRVLAQRIALFGWIEPRHLDVPVGEGTNGFLMFAQQELIKVNHYKAPRDKLICILNTCKVIFGLIRHLGTAESADTFIPILIFVVLKANPEHLLSNVEFINRFRNPAKLQSEAGYYLSSLMGAVSFIETMDHTSLSNITQEEFEHNVETAIQALPSSRPQSPPISASSSSSSSLATPLTPTRKASPMSGLPPPTTPTSLPPIQTAVVSPHAGDEPATPLALPAIDAKRLLQRTGDNLSKPLSAIGRIFSEALDSAEDMISQHLPPPPGLGQSTGPQGQGYGPQGQGYGPQTPGPWVGGTSTSQQGYGQGQGGQGSYAPWVPPPAVQTPYKPRIRRSPAGSPAGSYVEESPSRPPRPIPAPAPPINPATIHPSLLSPSSGGQFTPPSRSGTPNPDSELDIAGMQAEIDRAHAQAGDAARGTLRQIFPGVDGEVLGWVLEANEGDLGRSIEALLEMNGGQ